MFVISIGVRIVKLIFAVYVNSSNHTFNFRDYDCQKRMSERHFQNYELSTWLGARGQRRWNSSFAFIVRRLHPLPLEFSVPSVVYPCHLRRISRRPVMLLALVSSPT